MSMKASILSVFLWLTSVMAYTAPFSADQLARGKKIAETVCASCHGTDGNSVAAANPKIAGQHEEYLLGQLRAFKSGARANPIMMGMVAPLSEEEMRQVSIYFSVQTPKNGEASDENLANQGRMIYRVGNKSAHLPACMACHGPNGQGIPNQFPRLSGQFSSYIYGQLQAFKEGTVRKQATMQAIAQRMTDQEMKAVAEYIGGLR
jgi:cytochrome c553